MLQGRSEDQLVEGYAVFFSQRLQRLHGGTDGAESFALEISMMLAEVAEGFTAIILAREQALVHR